MVYLDWNATTPLAPEVLEAISRAASTAWGNPASVHAAGRAARKHVEAAREGVAKVLGFDARDVLLTGGGTEANNLAVRGLFDEVRAGEAPPVLVTTAVEHPSVLGAAGFLEARGVVVVRLPAPEGRLSVSALEAALDEHGERVRLVSVQAVNHETGIIQPLQEVRRACEARGVLLHTDAVQAVGRVDLSLLDGVDLVSIAAHKVRGPKGVGALASRCGVKVRPLLGGGAQERGVRPGTQDPLACAGFAAALARVTRGAEAYANTEPLRDVLTEALVGLGAAVNGAGQPRAPHVANLSFAAWRGPELSAAVDLEGVAISSGSACSAGTAEPSPVITHGWGRERARGAIRVSLGETTTRAEVERAISVFARVIARQPQTSRDG